MPRSAIKILLLLCFLVLLFTVRGKAQKYGNKWFFGYNLGLDFNTCHPVPVFNGKNSGFEGSSTVCDTAGQLLFYTNSDTVWDSTHVMMQNGNLLQTGGTLSQVIIIQKPGSSSLYYIITTKMQAFGTESLEYHVVDMTANSGLGAVVSKNNILSNLIITEQICATYHANGTDIWLVTHEYGTSNFLAFLVTSSGISLTPVISSSGPAHVSCTSNMNSRGMIKFSPAGNKLAMSGNGVGNNDATNILALFDFNKATGIVSNPLNLPYSRGEFGLSFSTDGSKLYGATWKAMAFTPNETNYLYQFDLSSGNPSTIIASKQLLDSSSNSYGDLKLGPDGKLYINLIGWTYICVVDQPNLPFPSCNFSRNGVNMNGMGSEWGLNN